LHLYDVPVYLFDGYGGKDMKSEWVTKWTLTIQMLGARHSVTGIAIWYIPFASSNNIKWLLV